MIYKRKPIDYTSFKQNQNLIYCLLTCLFLLGFLTEPSLAMSPEEMSELRMEVKQMFYHGFDSYVQHAYLYDELMPLSCRGRNRDTEPNRGDIDDILGNFSLTLIDAMDTLVVMNNLSEFQRSVDNVVRHVRFDSDIVVSVFETNIRVVGGLLSGHVLANLIKSKHPDYLQHYDGELLALAKDCATRLLPAFNTSTGIPYPRVNLRNGMDSSKIQNVKDTCTACAGTMVLEFGALSRLTNDTVFEQKARKAMDYLWKQRHRSSDLVGSVLNIHNGDWIRRESGVGAGIDSYYEYLLKAYILFGDESYLRRFNRHYEGIMKYISQGPLLVDVHMHKPRLNAKSFMDSLLAFWPGLQVLKGDLIPAIETHEILHQVSKMHNYLLPEAFNINDFQPYWAQFLIRPEFIESTYFLYEATKDEHYLEVGKQLIKSIKKFTMTPCGFAAVRDVRTGLLDDRMDSFVLSETFKYLYLLFTNKEDLIIDLNQFVFTTEAHFLPLSLSSVADKARFANGTLSSLHDHPSSATANEESLASSSKLRVCPNLNNLFKEQLERESFLFFKNRSNRASKQPPINYYEQVRKGLENYVELSNYEKMKYSTFSIQNFRDSDPGDNLSSREHPEQLLDELDLNTPIRLEPQDFTTSNAEHLKILKSMGINIIQMSQSDPVQLVHMMSQADDVDAGKEGIIFIKKMIQMSKRQTLSFNNYVSFVKFHLPFAEHHPLEVQLPACSSQFGVQLNKDEQLKFSGQAAIFTPIHACNRTEQSVSVESKFAILERGECMFINKVRLVERLGAIGVIIIDNAPDSSALSNPLFEMLGDQTNDVKIPVVLLYRKEADLLLDALKLDQNLILHITNIIDESEEKPMVKLVNSLKNARSLISHQLNARRAAAAKRYQATSQAASQAASQATGEQANAKVTSEARVKSNENADDKTPNLEEIKVDLQQLQALIKEKVNSILQGGQLNDGMIKLMEQYSKLKELALRREHLPNLMAKMEPTLQEFLSTAKQMIQLESFDSPIDHKPIDELFEQYGLMLTESVRSKLNKMSLTSGAGKVTKPKSDRQSCIKLSSDATKFRAYLTSVYWICAAR